MSVTSDHVRKMFGEGDDLRDARLTTPNDIERFDNISYGPDAKWNLLDMYTMICTNHDRAIRRVQSPV